MRLEGLTCSCLGCRCEDNRDESGPSLSGQAKSAQEFHLSPGSGQRPPGSAPTGLSQQPSPSLSLVINITRPCWRRQVRRAAPDGWLRGTAWQGLGCVAHEADTHGHSVAVGDVSISLYTWMLPLLGTTCLSAASFLLHAHWPDRPSRCSRCATPSAMVAQCLGAYRPPTQNNHPFTVYLALPWRPCSNHVCMSIASVRTPEPSQQD